MIARAILDAFELFVDDPAGILPPDALRGPRRAGAPGRSGFLDEAMIPDDPARACILAVIDDAVPFVHACLRGPGGASRVAAFWAQDAAVGGGQRGMGADLPFGIEWRGQGIGALLARLGGDLPDEDTLYRAAGVLDYARPTRPSAGYAQGHGAAVAGLAAGWDADDPEGRAHPVIAVSLPPRVTEDSMGTLAAPYVMSAILFIVQRARALSRFIEERRGLAAGSLRLPVVVVFSYGLTAGPRDGGTLLEQFMDAVSAGGTGDLGPVRFVLPMGNHRQDRLNGVLAPDQAMVWRVPPDDQTPNALEIWGPVLSAPPARPLQLRLAAPGCPAAETAFSAPDQMCRLRDGQGRELARACYTVLAPHGAVTGWREGVTVIAMPTCPARPDDPVAPAGDWTVAVAPGAPPGPYDICIQQDETIRGFHREARQSYLHDPAYAVWTESGAPVREDADPPQGAIRRSGTLNAYGGGQHTIRVGAVEGETRASIYSGHLGAGANGDLQAMGDRSVAGPGIRVAGRDSGSGWWCPGTSVAGPQAARWLARQMAAGVRPASRAEVVAQAQADGQGVVQPPQGPPLIRPPVTILRDF